MSPKGLSVLDEYGWKKKGVPQEMSIDMCYAGCMLCNVNLKV